MGDLHEYDALGNPHPTAPGTEPIRENRETPPRHVRWLIAGAGLGFILGMGAMEALS